MNTVKRRKFKWRYALVGVLAFYVVLCQSCMTMRMNSKETANYFDTLRVPYSSRTAIVGERKIHFIQTGNLEKQQWTPQSSGISIKPELVEELEAVWFDFLTTQ